jgi:hypothetical protein
VCGRQAGHLARVEVDGVLKDQGQLAPEVRRARETLLENKGMNGKGRRFHGM